jgi:hypothetical protein
MESFFTCKSHFFDIKVCNILTGKSHFLLLKWSHFFIPYYTVYIISYGIDVFFMILKFIFDCVNGMEYLTPSALKR